MAGFKEFVLRGNVIDLAVGVIIGTAFGGIVDSMTKDVTPIIGMVGGTHDFSAIPSQNHRRLLCYRQTLLGDDGTHISASKARWTTAAVRDSVAH